MDFCFITAQLRALFTVLANSSDAQNVSDSLHDAAIGTVVQNMAPSQVLHELVDYGCSDHQTDLSSLVPYLQSSWVIDAREERQGVFCCAVPLEML